MHVVTLHMPKGGVGRSATALALASAFAASGARVLVLEAARTGQFRFWEPWFAAQDPACPLARRVSFARARSARALAQDLRRARRMGFDVALVDEPAAPHATEPLVEEALREAGLIVLPWGATWEGQIASAEIEELGVDHAVGLIAGAPAAEMPRLRAGWGADPDRLLRATLARVPLAMPGPRLAAWPHALHARLLDREITRPPAGAGAPEAARPGFDLTAVLDGPAPSLVHLDALAGLVRDANRLAGEILTRLEGFVLTPLDPPEALGEFVPLPSAAARSARA